MLSYQHAYHAGTFADVIKHFILTCILEYMVKKEKPLLYLETHAGAGVYDLRAKEALKTAEALEGILSIWPAKKSMPTIFAPYVNAIEGLNPQGDLNFYPGSPYLAYAQLRQQDRLIFCELHPKTFKELETIPKKNKHVYIEQADGIQRLSAYLPPFEHRGLIFIDPAYEVKTEYSQIPKALKEAYKRFATGTFCLWYPIISNYMHEKLLRGLRLIATDKILRLEFYFPAKNQTRLQGSGLWIINPPFTLGREAKVGFDFLSRCKKGSSYLIKEGVQ